METFERRLRRFTFGSPREPFLNLVNSIANFMRPELTKAVENGQVYLFFLGSHAIIQTVSKNIYARTGRDGTLYYLKSFVDGPSPSTEFSKISHAIHSMRNVVAHQVLSRSMHNIVIDEKFDSGWKRSNGEIIINWMSPILHCAVRDLEHVRKHLSREPGDPIFVFEIFQRPHWEV